MLMIIFGAGASYDSLADYTPPYGHAAIDHLRPPLAKQVFEKRAVYDAVLQAYPQCAPVLEQLRRLGDKSIEQELERLQAQAEYDELRGQQLNAIKFYLRRILAATEDAWWQLTRGVNNYAALLDRVRNLRARSQEPVRLVTFNYDTLLERACPPALRLSFPYMTSYISREDYQLFKPHGSINWVRTIRNVVDSSRVEDSIIELGATLDLDEGYHIQSTGVQPGSHVHEGRYVFPALAIPVETKSKFEFPPEHRTALEAAIPYVTRLLLIGWRGTEQHFLDLWRPTAANLYRALRSVVIVAGSEQLAELVQKQVQLYMQGEYLVFSGGFSALVNHPDLDQLLA